MFRIYEVLDVMCYNIVINPIRNNIEKVYLKLAIKIIFTPLKFFDNHPPPDTDWYRYK